MRGRRLPLLLLVLWATPAAALVGPMHDGCHAAPPEAAAHPHQGVEHPAPRPRVSGDRVLSPDRFRNRPTQAAYRIAAGIPAVLDGLYCRCDCHDRDRLRSLLSCFENEMAATCAVCQEQAMAAHELHGAGKTLTEIRAALDAKYGRSGG